EVLAGMVGAVAGEHDREPGGDRHAGRLCPCRAGALFHDGLVDAEGGGDPYEQVVLVRRDLVVVEGGVGQFGDEAAVRQGDLRVVETELVGKVCQQRPLGGVEVQVAYAAIDQLEVGEQVGFDTAVGQPGGEVRDQWWVLQGDRRGVLAA